MRGEVLHFDEGQGFGYISGADGNPYTFRREDLRRQTAIAKGMTSSSTARPAGEKRVSHP